MSMESSWEKDKSKGVEVPGSDLGLSGVRNGKAPEGLDGVLGVVSSVPRGGLEYAGRRRACGVLKDGVFDADWRLNENLRGVE